jgi:hypothetical protein
VSGQHRTKLRHHSRHTEHRVAPSVRPRPLARHIGPASRLASDLFVPDLSHAH